MRSKSGIPCQVAMITPGVSWSAKEILEVYEFPKHSIRNSSCSVFWCRVLLDVWQEQIRGCVMSFIASSYHRPSILEALKEVLTKSDCSMSGDGHVGGKLRKNIIMANAINTGSKRTTAVRFFSAISVWMTGQKSRSRHSWAMARKPPSSFSFGKLHTVHVRVGVSSKGVVSEH